MSLEQSLRLKKRWATISPERRSKMMSKIASIRQSRLSVKEKRAQALKMVRARSK